MATGEFGIGQVKREIVFIDCNESFHTDAVKSEPCEIDNFTEQRTHCNSSSSKTDFVYLRNATDSCQEQNDEKFYVNIKNPEDLDFKCSDNSSNNILQIKSDDIDIIHEDIKRETGGEISSELSRFCEVCYKSFVGETDALKTTSNRVECTCQESNDMTPVLEPSPLGHTVDPVLLDELRSKDEENNKEQHLSAESERPSGPPMEMTEKKFHCKFCSKPLSSKAYLKIHIRRHTGEKIFNCQTCSKVFFNLATLKVHDRIHAGEKPFQCKICTKAFVDVGNLRVHERVHTGEKPFQCKICFKTFGTSTYLKKHEKTHSGIKPFQCKICTKAFVDSSNLKVHERVHTGEKPYQCKICSKAFGTFNYLKTHEKSHTEKKQFQCKICTKEFADASNLRVHKILYNTIH